MTPAHKRASRICDMPTLAEREEALRGITLDDTVGRHCVTFWAADVAELATQEERHDAIEAIPARWREPVRALARSFYAAARAVPAPAKRRAGRNA